MNREFIGGLAITADTTAGDQSLSNGVVKNAASRRSRHASRSASLTPPFRQSRQRSSHTAPVEGLGRGEEVKLLTLAVQLVAHGDGSGR